MLKYHNVQLEDAFMCAGARCTLDSTHVAVVVCSRSVYKWVCTILEDQNGDLSKDQLMWLPSRTGECHPFGTAAVLMCHICVMSIYRNEVIRTNNGGPDE